MSRNLRSRLLVACTSLPLAACPSGTYMASAPIPPPPVNPPPPPPPPPSAQSPAIFPGITTNTDFATLGLTSSLVRDGFSVKFDVASNAYVIGLPSHTPGAFVANSTTDDRFWFGYIQGSTRGDTFSVFKPSASNPDIQLAYTSYGIASGYYSGLLDFVAFGSPTPASGVPLTGSATYDANVSGEADSSGVDAGEKTISGTAALQFDFGAGKLTGHFDPILNARVGNLSSTTNLGTYAFVNTVFGAGKANFSGQLSVSGSSTLGNFDGQFTGPTAQELMARWTAPYLIPSNLTANGSQSWSQMFGVWVGKKH